MSSSTSAPSSPNTPEFRLIRTLTHLMEGVFRVPGTSFTFGLDPLIGLFPVAGDAISLSISALIVLAAARTGVPPTLLARMILNILADYFIGLTPVIGDAADFGFKANSMNMRLMEEYFTKGDQPLQKDKALRKVSLGVLIALGVILALMIVGLVSISWILVSAVLSLL